MSILIPRLLNAVLTASLPALHRPLSAHQETYDPQLERQYDGFKHANLGSIGHELRVFGDILLVCMWFGCVKLSVPLSEVCHEFPNSLSAAMQ